MFQAEESARAKSRLRHWKKLNMAGRTVQGRSGKGREIELSFHQSKLPLSKMTYLGPFLWECQILIFLLKVILAIFIEIKSDFLLF